MKSLLICSATLLAAASLVAADKDDVASAVQKLADSDNYSWTMTVDNGQNTPAPSHGKIQKDGLVWMQMAMRDNTVEAFVKGGKGALKTENGWEALDLTAAPARGAGGNGGDGASGRNNPARYMGRRLRNFKAPAAEAADIIGKAKDLTKTGDAYSADLTEDGAKSLLTMGGRGRRAGAEAPTVADAKGSVKFWIKDGVLTKYELKISGTVTYNGNDRDIDRTTTVEIKDVGATTITMPDEAKSKLG